MATNVDKDMNLHFIDRAYSGLVEVNQLQTRLLIFLSISSFIVASLSLGLISITQTFSISGLNLALPFGLILASGSILICLLFVFLSIALIRRDELTSIIKRLYKEINYNDKSLFYDYGNPSVPFDIYNTSFRGKSSGVVNNIFNNLSLLIAVLLVILVPLIVPGMAIYRLIVIFNWTWSVFILIAIDIIILAIGFWHLSSHNEEE